MTYVLAIIAGALGAALGWAAAAALTIVLGQLFGASDFEGALALTAVWGVGPIGGLVGLIGGIWLTLLWGGHRTLPALVLRLPLVVFAVVALAAGGLWMMYELRPTLGTSSSGPPRLDFEIRLPPGVALPERPTRIEVQLNTERNRMPGQVFDGRTSRDGDRVVVSGSVELAYRSSWRLLDVVLGPGQPTYIFDLKLGARPGHMKAAGDWRRVDYVAVGSGQPRVAKDSDTVEIRYRVVYRDMESVDEAGKADWHR
jgi:hypothetical protein